MKIGKFIPLGDHKDVKVGYGTVDFKNLKTIYLKLNSWVQPKNDEDDFDYMNLVVANFKTPLKEMSLQIDLNQEDKWNSYLYS